MIKSKVSAKRGLALVIFVLLLQPVVIFAQKSKVAENVDLVFHNTANMMQHIHYAPKTLDDKFAAQIFNTYLQTLDAGKRFFLQEDIKEFKKYEFQLDDELRGKQVQFYKVVNARFRQRLDEAEKLINELLKEPFTFNRAETYNTNMDNQPWTGSADEQRARWKNYLKYQVLVQFDDLLELQSKDSVSSKDSASSKEELEKKAREIVSRIEKRYIENLRKLTTEDESFNTYINSVINLYDPHSNYFLPVDRREFQENMSGIYYGIGALLQEQQGKVSIGELMLGGPAAKSGQVEKGDVIVRVAQEGQKPVEVAGMGMQDVIKMIRGAKGTTVTITFRKQDGKLKDVAMQREALQLEDTFVKSAIIEDHGRIGYISFPRFYTDFGDDNGRSSAKDMAAELEKLKAENVHSVIIDIRNNGGGSLGEVINMVGLFIKSGPVVQVKSPTGKPYVANTNTGETFFDGPVIVLVNEMSASASEIFAAAIQDYKRGIIVGSSSTYGKGSVQRSFGIANNRQLTSQSTELGTINITLQKYYRITGEATQLKGIVPDILLPGIYEPYDIQEKNNPTALAWDKIDPVPFTPVNDGSVFGRVIAQSQSRIQQDTVLQALRKNLNWLKNRPTKFSLQLDAYRKEQEQLQNKVETIRRELINPDSLNIRNTADVEKDLQEREQFRRDSNKAWLNSLKKDLYLAKAVQVMEDYLRIRNTGQASKS
jgi:carboxyl-terminal processing protease